MRGVRTARVIATLAAASVAALGVAAPAFAHVTVEPGEVAKGGYARLDFRVPNESDTESTTKVEVFLPDDTPIASVRIKPVPGWSAELTTRTLDEPIETHGLSLTEVVSQITWTAQSGSEIKPGEFQEFPVTMGPMPEDVDQVAFKALQTYSDDAIVRWIEVPSDADPDPANPAPILQLVNAEVETDPHAPGEQQATPQPTPTTQATAEPAGGVPGWLALSVGALGLLAALVALWRTRGSGNSAAG